MYGLVNPSVVEFQCYTKGNYQYAAPVIQVEPMNMCTVENTIHFLRGDRRSSITTNQLRCMNWDKDVFVVHNREEENRLLRDPVSRGLIIPDRIFTIDDVIYRRGLRGLYVRSFVFDHYAFKLMKDDEFKLSPIYDTVRMFSRSTPDSHKHYDTEWL